MAKTGYASPASFGVGYAVAVLALGLLDITEALLPSLEEWAEATFFHSWFHFAVLGIIIFLVLGLAGVGRQQDLRQTLVNVVGSTVIAGLLIVGAALLSATRGASM